MNKLLKRHYEKKYGKTYMAEIKVRETQRWLYRLLTSIVSTLIAGLIIYYFVS